MHVFPTRGPRPIPTQEEHRGTPRASQPLPLGPGPHCRAEASRLGVEGTEWGRTPWVAVHWSESVPPLPPTPAHPLPQFEEIHEVIARYKTLVSMHHDLMQSAQEGQEKVEHAKARLARYKEEKDDEILQHNNELARLQMRFDRARSDVIIWVSAPGG